MNNNTPKPELKPCPFCGGNPEIAGWSHVITCFTEGCLGSSSYDWSSKDRDQSITAWNTRTHQWQPIDSGPSHRNDVLILSASGHIGIGWFSQMESGPSLNIEYLGGGDLKPTLDEEVATRRVTHWMPKPEEPTPPGDDA